VRLNDGAVAVGATALVLGPGCHDDYHGHGVVCASGAGPVAVAVAELMKVAVVGAATAAGVGMIVAEPGGRLAAASAEHTRASQDQTVSPVGEGREA